MGKCTAVDSLCKYVSSEPPTRNGRIKARHTLVSGEMSLPKHDVTEGLMPLALGLKQHLALISIDMDCKQHVKIYVVAAWTGIRLVSE